MTREAKIGSFSLRDILSIAPTYRNKFDYPLTGEGKFEVRKGMPWPTGLEDGLYAYVLMLPRKDAPEGALCIAMHPRPRGNIHHPELTHRKGIKEPKEVIAAGMMRIINDEVHYLDNESGHYCPGQDSLIFIKKVLEYWGIKRAQNIETADKWTLLIAH